MLQDYEFVKHRRNGSTIYRCKEYTHYMKVGPWEEIQQEVRLYELLLSYDVPMPKLLGYEMMTDGLWRMKEESLKGKLYSEIFTESCDTHGFVEDSILDQFITYQKKHLVAQRNTIGKKVVDRAFDCHHHLHTEWFMESDKAHALMQKIDGIGVNVPHGRNHGDHNAYNIFQDGLIDLEDSFEWYLWYDTVTAITQNYRFPASWAELCRQHAFTEKQMRHYLTQLSTDDMSFLDSDTFGLLFLMRWIFCTVETQDAPMLQAYRYKRLHDAIDALFAGENMLEFFVKSY